MTKFDFSDEQVSIVDTHGHYVELSPQEALELLQWLSDRRMALVDFPSHQNTSHREQIAIHLQPQDLVYLDALKSAIPHLQEFSSAAKIFMVPADTVTERAIQLLNAYRIEYKIHPMLEDDNAFAQG